MVKLYCLSRELMQIYLQISSPLNETSSSATAKIEADVEITTGKETENEAPTSKLKETNIEENICNENSDDGTKNEVVENNSQK